MTRRTRRTAYETLEHRLLFAADLRAIDGTGNNLQHPDWGSTESAFIRLAKPAYADGKSEPAGKSRPSARAVSNAVAAHPADEEILNDRHMAAFVYAWGQFIDHDLDLTNTGAGAFSVAVPKGDAYFDPTGTGTQIIPLTRSQFVTDANGVRQQVNSITAYIDGSMVYGSDEATADSLRAFAGGRLKTSNGDLLPTSPDGVFFVAGDIRVNENPELTAIHTLFLREHNRLAGQIASRNASWTDEQIFQQARRLVIGEIQAITYNEFLPVLLGQNPLSRYTGYKPNVNPGVANEFATAAYRLGHSMLADDVEFITNDGEEAAPEMALKDVFFQPGVIHENGIDTILKYLASSNAEEIDNRVVDGVRNFLFGQPGQGGFDLASLNIQRGRDHGLADYNSTRAALGLAKVTSFGQVTSDPELASALKSLYGSVDNIDLWVGGLAEDHAPGASVGPTFRRIIADQFTRSRDGDRFWYERDLNATDRARVVGTKLADVLKLNTGITNVQQNVFIFDVKVTGRVFDDTNGNGRPDGREPGMPNVPVQLIDEEGAVVKTVRTDREGGYRFADLQIGDYTVRPAMPAGTKPTTATSSPIDVTRGMAFNGVTFGAQRIRPSTPTSPTNPPPPPPRGGMPGAILPTRITSQLDELLA